MATLDEYDVAQLLCKLNAPHRLQSVKRVHRQFGPIHQQPQQIRSFCPSTESLRNATQFSKLSNSLSSIQTAEFPIDSLGSLVFLGTRRRTISLESLDVNFNTCLKSSEAQTAKITPGSGSSKRLVTLQNDKPGPLNLTPCKPLPTPRVLYFHSERHQSCETRRVLSDDSACSSDMKQELDHFNWAECEGQPESNSTLSVSLGTDSKIKSDAQVIEPQMSPSRTNTQRERQYVGRTTKSGKIRGTIRKKFSWKKYPKLEEYLLINMDEYFDYSSKNYTAQQRKYNNDLTRGLLELASDIGYVFENFTFPMVRDRIRCYFKSYSQSVRKKAIRSQQKQEQVRAFDG